MASLRSIALLMLWSVPSLASTLYYVDPDYTGGSNDGSAAHPWVSLTSGTWTNISASLSSNDVVLYLSPLKANGTTQQSQAWFVNVRRSDPGVNRLTVDGYSFYNSNISTPSWQANPQTSIAVAYTNGQVCKLTGDGSQAIGWGRTTGQSFVTNSSIPYCCIESHLSAAGNQPGVGANWRLYWDQHGVTNAGATAIGNSTWSSGVNYICYVKQNNVTLRGFEITGSGARSAFSGDNTIWEYIYTHDITTSGACLTLLYTSYPDGSTAAIISAPVTNTTLRNFRVVNTQGEGLYIGSGNPDVTTNFSALHGNQRDGVLITNFYIYGTGVNGGEGDGIDNKHGTTHLHIVDGEIGFGTNQGNGLIIPETMTNIDQGSVIERVYVHDFAGVGGGGYGIIGSSQGAGADLFYGHSGTTIRNCIVYKCNGNNGIGFGGFTPSIITNCFIYNCTVYGGQVGIVLVGGTNCGVKNNFAFQGSDLRFTIGSAGIVSDYNAHDGSIDSPSEGAHTITMTTPQAVAAVVSTNTPNFNLVTNSLLIGAALTISSFSNDFVNSIRVAPWDIGAYAYSTNPPTPGPSGTTYNTRIANVGRIIKSP